MREPRLRFGCLALLTQNRPAVSIKKCIVVDCRLRFGALGTDQTLGVPAMVVVECEALILNRHSARRTQVRGHFRINSRLSLELALELVPVGELNQFVKKPSNDRCRVVLPLLDEIDVNGAKVVWLFGCRSVHAAECNVVQVMSSCYISKKRVVGRVFSVGK